MGRNKHFIKPADFSPAELETKRALIRSLCRVAIPKLVTNLVHKLSEIKDIENIKLRPLWHDYSEIIKQMERAFLHLELFAPEETLSLLRDLYSIFLPPLSPEMQPSLEDQMSPDKIKQLLLDLANHKSLGSYLGDIRTAHPELIKEVLASLNEKQVKFIPTANDLSKSVKITAFFKQNL